MLKVLILNVFLLFHPVHITLTTINQDQGSDTLKVFFRMYYDDFQRDYNLYYPEFKPRGNNDTTGIAPEMLNKYFNDRVRIYVNHKLLPGKLLDVSFDLYEIRMNLIYSSDNKPRNFRISNQILTSIYKDQANMVYLNINNYEDAIKLTVEHFEQAVNLKY